MDGPVVLIVICTLIIAVIVECLNQKQRSEKWQRERASRAGAQSKESEMKDAVARTVSEAGGSIDDSFGTECAFLAVDIKRGRLAGVSDEPSVGQIDMALADITSVDIIDHCSDYAKALEMEIIHRDMDRSHRHRDYVQTYHPFALRDGHRSFEGFTGRPVYGLVIHTRERMSLHIPFYRGGSLVWNETKRFIEMKDFARRLSLRLGH